MNFQFYVEKLKESEGYKKFMQENPDAFPFSGFFILELENVKHPDNKQHIDFFVPSKKKAFSFQVESNCKMVPVKIIDSGVGKISLDQDFDFEKVQSIIIEEMQQRKVSNKLQKILLSLQNKAGRDFLIGTAFLSNFGLLKVNIDLTDMKITDFEKKSFFDMLKFTGKKEDKLEIKKE